MPTAMVSLIGEQPAPNLLPARYLKPDRMVLVHTNRTARVARNLKSLLEPGIQCEMCEVPPYSITDAFILLRRHLKDRAEGCKLIFNLTGGTKTMVLAAFHLAHRIGSPFVYFRTEGNRSLLYRCRFVHDGISQKAQPDEIKEIITLHDYLKMYLGDFTEKPPEDSLEVEVMKALESIEELEAKYCVRPKGMEALEIDFVVRFGNQVGIGEVKSKAAKDGIDQVNAVAHPRYLGTYVKKFLISGSELAENNKDLAEAYKIEVVELTSFSTHGKLSQEDREKLKDSILKELGGRKK